MDANDYYLNQYLKRLSEEDKRDSAIEERTEEIFNDSLATLNKLNRVGTKYQQAEGYNMWDVVDDIKQPVFKGLADLYLSGDKLALGKAFYDAITTVLMDRAKDQATEEVDNIDECDY
jgi:hypothetical protein